MNFVSPRDFSSKPTRDTYDRFQQAFEHFNKTLFDGTLPNALITLQRRKGSFGFFVADRFHNREGAAADEIALNPATFRERRVEDILAVLVHEMVHLWQHHHGLPGRGRYHNREWAAKMLAVGLQPTDNGAPDGKATGETVSQIITHEGLFAKEAARLVDRGFLITWHDAPASSADSAHGTGGEETPTKSGKRVRYCCPKCDLKAWAKHGATLVCGVHMTAMAARGPDALSS